MSQHVQSRLDHLIETSQTPGLQYVVVNADQTIFGYVGGCADLASQKPMSASTTMMAYSMSKTITAAAVLQIIESHGLNVDDPIIRFLEYFPYGPNVTLRMLLAHTSGIPNPIPLTWVHALTDHATFNEHDALAAVLRQHSHLSFAPGTKYGYSNIGYWLLGEFIERVSGHPLASYVHARVFQPLGIPLGDLGYTITHLSDHAHGYLEKYSLINAFRKLLLANEFIGSYQGRWLEIHPHYLNGAGFGGLVGTAGGFAKFLRDQLAPHSLLFNDLSRSQFYAPQQTGNAIRVPTSLGWHIGTLNGANHFYKEGGGAGFHCMMRLYPRHGIATVIMANATRINVCRLLDTLDPEFFFSSN